MTTRQKGDWEATREQLSWPTYSPTGETWLRHRANSQAAMIDFMILEGKYTIVEIAQRLNQIEARTLPLLQRILRVRDHIEHLKEGGSAIRRQKPHGLKIKTDAQGKLSFDL